MAKGYWIVRADVTTRTNTRLPGGQRRGVQQIRRAVPGARRLVRGAGRDARPRNVVHRVPELSGGAVDCYRSPEYQRAKAHARGRRRVRPRRRRRLRRAAAVTTRCRLRARRLAIDAAGRRRRAMSDMKLVVVGAAGRMGRTLIRVIAETEGVSLAGAIERAGAPEIGADAGALAGVGETGVAISADPLPVFAEADGVLDFTVPAATLAFAELAAQARIVHVIGTTGLSAGDDEQDQRGGAPRGDRAFGQHEPRRQSPRRAGAPGGEGARRRLRHRDPRDAPPRTRWTRRRARR